MKRILVVVLLVFFYTHSNSQSVIVGTGTGVSAFSPIIRSYDYCIYEVIYPAAEIGTGGTISMFGFERVDGTNTDPIDSVSIYMQHTVLTDLTTGTFSTSGYTLVFQGSFPNSFGSGWREVELTYPFFYDGVNNLQVLVVKGYQAAVGNTPVSPRWYYTQLTGTPARRSYGNVPITGNTVLNTTVYRSNARLDFGNVGLVELGSAELKVFPNPASEFIDIHANISNATLQLFDHFGRQIFSADFNTTGHIPLQSLASGLYYLRLTDPKSEKTMTKTITKN